MTNVYCVPGTMCNEVLWQDVMSYLPDHMSIKHVVIPDQGSIAEMVSGILKQLPSTPVNLLGFSLGGYLLSEIARVAPERINAAMVLSNSAGALPENEKQQRLQALQWVSQVGYRGIPIKKAKAMLAPINAQNDRLVEKIVAMDKALGQETFVAQLQATIERQNNTTAVARSGCKWLVLAGLADQFVTAESLNQLAQFDNVSVNVVAQSGHMLPLEQPKWVASKMTNFFNCSD